MKCKKCGTVLVERNYEKCLCDNCQNQKRTREQIFERALRNRNVNMQNFKDTKCHFQFEMSADWDEKSKFLNQKQLDLIHKVVYEMTDEQGEEWFKKWYTQYQLERISAAFLKCYNKVLRFKKKENMINSLMNGEKIPRGVEFERVDRYLNCVFDFIALISAIIVIYILIKL